MTGDYLLTKVSLSFQILGLLNNSEGKSNLKNMYVGNNILVYWKISGEDYENVCGNT